MPSMNTEATRGLAKRFAPLDPLKGNTYKAPSLKGIVFDVDGTIWYVSPVPPLCLLFCLPDEGRKEKKEKKYDKIDYSCVEYAGLALGSCVKSTFAFFYFLCN